MTDQPRYRIKGTDTLVVKTDRVWRGLEVCKVIVPGIYDRVWQGEGVLIWVEEKELEAV